MPFYKPTYITAFWYKYFALHCFRAVFHLITAWCLSVLLIITLMFVSEVVRYRTTSTPVLILNIVLFSICLFLFLCEYANTLHMNVCTHSWSSTRIWRKKNTALYYHNMTIQFIIWNIIPSRNIIPYTKASK